MKKLSFLILTVLGCSFITCKKEKIVEPAQPSPCFVRMTDAPGPYTAVNVDIQSVEITSNGSTVLLNTNSGIYNLLNFSNGVDTLIATGDIVAEKVQQIRLILGPNNSVVTGGVAYPLSTPSADQNGLKLQVHHTLEAGVGYYILLDFDANQSIVEEGNGSYKLKPVIRTVESAISGSIKGSVSQPNIMTTITATSNNVSYSSVVNANGEFIIKGLPAGTYSLTITPVSPYASSAINNITVTTGITSTVGVVII